MPSCPASSFITASAGVVGPESTGPRINYVVYFKVYQCATSIITWMLCIQIFQKFLGVARAQIRLRISWWEETRVGFIGGTRLDTLVQASLVGIVCDIGATETYRIRYLVVEHTTTIQISQ